MDYISPLKTILVKTNPSQGTMFRFCTQYTVAMLVGCSVFLTANEFFGETINCMTELEDSKNVVDTYCWTHSTFTFPQYVLR